jgi:signal peptidase II
MEVRIPGYWELFVRVTFWRVEMYLYFIYLVGSILILGLDQLVKHLIVANISIGESVSVIPGVLSLTQLHNTGAAWGMLDGQMFFFYIITAIVAVVVLYFLKKFYQTDKLMSISLMLILGGAIGNLIDRARLGYVVDMFQTDFMNFPIFNVADISLVIGVFLMILWVFLDEKKKKA